MFSKGLPIECLFHTDNTCEMDDLDLDYPLYECEKRVIVFYSINSIAKHFDYQDDKKEYAEIHSNGTTYITDLKAGQLQKLIEEHLKLYR